MREKLTKLFGSHLINLDMLPDDPVIVDAGACVGDFIKDIKKHVKDPYVFAIEPSKSNIPKLRELTEGTNLIIIKAAFVGRKEPMHMQFAEIQNLPEWGNVTGLYGTRKSVKYNVLTFNIRDLLEAVPLKIIDYLKMDIEASEWDVVNDMDEVSARRIKQISMEIHSHQLDITKKLEDLGYETFFENGELYAVRQGN